MSYHVSPSCNSMCQNNGTCIIENGYKSCLCSQAFSGQQCEINIDECQSSPCKHGGKCIDGLGQFICSCPIGYSGSLCEVIIDPCLNNPCENNGTCIRLQTSISSSSSQIANNFQCVCPPDYSGRYCQLYVKDYCISSPCYSYATCVNLPYPKQGYFCYCPPTHPPSTSCDRSHPYSIQTSKLCDQREQCVYGNCTNERCSCFHGWTGDKCDQDIDECLQNPCPRQGTCYNTLGSYLCLCPSNSATVSCQSEKSNECSEFMCLNGGTCNVRQDGSAYCRCSPSYYGFYCESYIGINDRLKQDDYCTLNNCPSKAQNGQCDQECNVEICDYDKGECSFNRQPWHKCKQAKLCSHLFNNAQCDLQCNTKECFYDGGDCEQKQQLIPQCNVTYCDEVIHNGLCEQECNTVQCNFDFEDCQQKSTFFSNNLLGTIVFEVKLDKNEFDNKKLNFTNALSDILRSQVKIASNKDGSELILPWYKEKGNDKKKQMGTKIYLNILKNSCNNKTNNDELNCFDSIQQAGDYLSALEQQGRLEHLLQGVPVKHLNIVPESEQVKDRSKLIYLLFFIPCFLFIVALISYTIIRRPKIIHAPIWFPPLATAATTKNQYNIGSGGGGDVGYDKNNNKIQKLTKKVNEQDHELQQPKTKRQKLNNEEDQYVTLPTPPSEQSTSLINHPGPSNITPIALAIMKRNPLGKEDSTERLELEFYINNGCDLTVRLPPNDETLLHLACRYSRLVACELILKYEEDLINSRDINGATPLLYAVGTGLLHVVQFLLQHPKIDVNTCTYINQSSYEQPCGDNPLRKAIRLEMNDIAKCLLLTRQDIQVDAHDRWDKTVNGEEKEPRGRTALHWAASVDNVDGAELLLRNGANIEALDENDETPLFKAAASLNFEMTIFLLRNNAKQQVINSSGQTPQTVAYKNYLSHKNEQYLQNIKAQSQAEINFQKWLFGHYPLPCDMSLDANTNRKKSKKQQQLNSATRNLYKMELSSIPTPPTPSHYMLSPPITFNFQCQQSHVAMKQHQQQPSSYNSYPPYPTSSSTNHYSMSFLNDLSSFSTPSSLYEINNTELYSHITAPSFYDFHCV
ncbi:unnamed protein product [Didymodactylos carnosus]|uniref:Notch n=1 Tax=Didymodactylos carnosus TaxID=1234261 RepID=A0A813UN96_9BILA|nr:unnamed protein product [Didymodactylos carnosus]CAF3612896.1 unnamed protein product [Didymodactylos carnosus]